MKGSAMRLALSTLLLASIALVASADESPRYGKVTSVDLTRALVYECAEARGEFLDCHFTHVAVRTNARHCYIATQRFSKSFKRVARSASGVEAWAAEGADEGPCGLVDLSRFESEKPADQEKQSSKRWRYVEKTKMSNPKGKFRNGVSCTVVDENEYVYDWRTRKINVGCDYIDFELP